MDFKNKRVLVTGASSGIGRETAIAFSKKGASLILAARRRDRLEQLKQELPTEALVCPCDVSKGDRVEKMARTVLEQFGSVDILVNNAGFAIYGAVSDLSTDDIKSQMETNYFGMVHCIKEFLPSMLEKKSGRIVNVASVAASFGLPGMAPYCASKYSMLGFSEGLKHELKNTGIGVTVVSPIMVRTEFFDHPSFANVPRHSQASLDPKNVAKTILQAAGSPRLEIITPPIVRGAVWLKQTFPYLINPIMAWSFKRSYSSESSDSEPTSSSSKDFSSN